MFNPVSRRYATTAIRQQPSHRLLSTTTTTSTLRPRTNTRNAKSQRPPQNTRALNTSQIPQYDSSKDWRKNPLARRLVITALVGSLGLLAYLGYKRYMDSKKYAAFPPEVMKFLRRAMFYTEVEPDIQEAMKYFREALAKAREVGMDDFSKEVTGMRLAVADALEKAGMVSEAVGVYEKLRTDCLRYVQQSERGTAVNLEARAEMPKNRGEPIPIDLPEHEELAEYAAEYIGEFQKRRTIVLARAIGISGKLADLYAGDHLQDEEKTEANRVKAVELCLHEMQRRQKLKLPIGGAATDNDPWLTLTELATVLAELGDMYYSHGKHELALPVMLRGLDLLRAHEGDTRTCKQLHFIGSIAANMSALSIGISLKKKEPPKQQHGKPLSINQMMENARQWALKGLELDPTIKPPVRDASCDEECVGMLMNLGQMMCMLGEMDEAIQYSNECKRRAQEAGLEAAAKLADDDTKELQKIKKEQEEPSSQEESSS